MQVSPGNLASRPQDLEILLIGLGQKVYALPLQDVRHVARVDPKFAASGEQVADYFVFEGEPLSYVSLWDVLAIESAYAEYHALETMLPQREQDHLDWMSALEISIREHVPFTKARSPRECAFGKWFYAHQASDLRLETMLSQFEQPHAKIPALADYLLSMAESGQRETALQLFAVAQQSTLVELIRLFDSSCQLVVELQRRIAIIVDDGTRTCALGADMIQNIVTVPPEQIRAESRGSMAVAALVILDDQRVVPVLNWRAMSSQTGLKSTAGYTDITA